MVSKILQMCNFSWVWPRWHWHCCHSLWVPWCTDCPCLISLGTCLADPSKSSAWLHPQCRVHGRRWFLFLDQAQQGLVLIIKLKCILTVVKEWDWFSLGEMQAAWVLPCVAFVSLVQIRKVFSPCLRCQSRLRRTKAMDMRFHWLQYCKSQSQFQHYWHPETDYRGMVHANVGQKH